MLRTAVIGASGYAGGELMRLIQSHPKLQLAAAVANTHSGRSIMELFPNLGSNFGDFIAMEQMNWEEFDVFFLALPHGESAKYVQSIPNDAIVIDLGADFRLTSSSAWKEFYKSDHAGTWQYGLADIANLQNSIRESKRIANPGCYATSINLSLYPFITYPQIGINFINIVAASGTSGAGRKATSNLLTADNMNDLVSYKVGGLHQHIPEIEQFLNSSTDREVKIGFTPILAPMPRGILAVSTIHLSTDHKIDELRAIFLDTYAGNPFINLLPIGHQPHTKAVAGTNNAYFQIALDEKVNSLIITCAIDNLIKGAAGQAIQNLNLLIGEPIDTGLVTNGIFP